MEVKLISKKDYKRFEKLFCDYYVELDCEDDPLHLFREYVLADLKANLLQAALCVSCGNAEGFVIFQTDDVINDWCFKDGWGDVRELYVMPSLRQQGFGTALLKFAEEALKKAGAQNIYTLPTEESEKFFLSRGYSDTGEYCAELDNKVFGKTLNGIDKSDIL